MELKLIDDNGQSSASVSAPDALFAREYNEALVHQVVTAYLPMLAAPTVLKKAVPMSRNPLASLGGKKVQAAPRGHGFQPAMARWGKIFPNSPEENFSHKVNRKMYRAGIGAILSQLVRENRFSVVENFTVDTPKTKALAQKLKGMQLERGHDYYR